MVKRMVTRTLLYLGVVAVVLAVASCQSIPKPAAHNGGVLRQPYLVETGLVSRSICFENPTGAPGQGGKAASKLGVGRKGAPAIDLKAGQQVQLCDVTG